MGNTADTTQDILQSTLQVLRTQVIYLRNLQDAFSALHDAVLRANPELARLDNEEMAKIRPNPLQQSHLDALDALLARLEKSQ